jgi:hypothetical protein
MRRLKQHAYKQGKEFRKLALRFDSLDQHMRSA